MRDEQRNGRLMYQRLCDPSQKPFAQARVAVVGAFALFVHVLTGRCGAALRRARFCWGSCAFTPAISSSKETTPS